MGQRKVFVHGIFERRENRGICIPNMFRDVAAAEDDDDGDDDEEENQKEKRIEESSGLQGLPKLPLIFPNLGLRFLRDLLGDIRVLRIVSGEDFRMQEC